MRRWSIGLVLATMLGSAPLVAQSRLFVLSNTSLSEASLEPADFGAVRSSTPATSATRGGPGQPQSLAGGRYVIWPKVISAISVTSTSVLAVYDVRTGQTGEISGVTSRDGPSPLGFA